MSRKLARKSVLSALSVAAAAAACAIVGTNGTARADTLVYSQDFTDTTGLESTNPSGGYGVTIGVIDEGEAADGLANTNNPAISTNNFYTGYTAYAIVATTAG